MNIENCVKESFSVIGKEGSTEDGPGFVQSLWADANSHFPEVAHLAKYEWHFYLRKRLYEENAYEQNLHQQ